jgi:signal peptidase I
MISTTILILAGGVFTSRIGLPASSKPFKVPTASMCPTICEGERIMADLEAYKDRPPEPGDLVMLEINPGKPLFIKRVIAVGGDIVKQGSHGEVLVNGIPIPQPTICSSPRDAYVGRNDHQLRAGHGTCGIVFRRWRQSHPQPTVECPDLAIHRPIRCEADRSTSTGHPCPQESAAKCAKAVRLTTIVVLVPSWMTFALQEGPTLVGPHALHRKTGFG